MPYRSTFDRMKPAVKSTLGLGRHNTVDLTFDFDFSRPEDLSRSPKTVFDNL